MHRLRQQGMLSEQEFAQQSAGYHRTGAAFAEDVKSEPAFHRLPTPDFLSTIAQQYVLCKAVGAVVGPVLLLIFLFRSVMPLVEQFQR